MNQPLLTQEDLESHKIRDILVLILASAVVVNFAVFAGMIIVKVLSVGG